MTTPNTPTPVPTPNPAAPAAGSESRRAQVALGVFLAVMLGMLLYRGYGARLAARPTQAVAVSPVDLNTADRTELAQIPGIGPQKASAIADYRTLKGPFKSVEDLRGVHGFGLATVEKLRPFLRVEPGLPDPEPLTLERKQAPQPLAARTPGTRKLQPGDPPVNVNTATAEQLQQLDGIGPKLAQAIIDARPFAAVDDLDRVKGIGKKTLDKIRPFAVVK